jgi:hypothetical protein
MSRSNTERFLATSEAHLMGKDGDSRHIPQAALLLVREFKKAITAGPETLVSAPENMRDSQTTLANIFWRMLDDDESLLVDLLVELKHGTKDDVIEFLAHTYAAWVIASYDTGAFK